MWCFVSSTFLYLESNLLRTPFFTPFRPLILTNLILMVGTILLHITFLLVTRTLTTHFTTHFTTHSQQTHNSLTDVSCGA